MKKKFSWWIPAVAGVSAAVAVCGFEVWNSQQEKEILNFGKVGGSHEITVTVPVRYSILGQPEYMVDAEAVMCSMAVDLYDNRGYEEAAVTRLYAFLIAKGRFKKAVESAMAHGHPKEFAEKIYFKVVQKIKDSPYKEVIEKLNDIDVDKM